MHRTGLLVLVAFILPFILHTHAYIAPPTFTRTRTRIRKPSTLSSSSTSAFKSHFVTIPVSTHSTLHTPASPSSPDGSVSTYDLTSQVLDAVSSSKITHGTVVITTPHTTVGLCVNETSKVIDLW
ncbi:hypothetical protein TrRE_jg8762 [Triparma retinervis]|uniref:Uncharacterized protein n=1 Tax=Triparma retinervis TaxID=2557542 RepID=A0A9W7L4V8_9STRA|nr:hypothetical protein TrRE_jg8762 [Triparma retinervis]